jgi:hypothetical protein
MLSLARRILLLSALALLVPVLARGQVENIQTVEGPRGEQMTLTAQPHSLADGLSARAIGIETLMDSTRWALSLIGAEPGEEVSIHYGNESLPVRDVRPPEDGGVGPIKVYVSQETFLTMAETGGVRLRVGGVTATLPEQMRREMQIIFERVS